MRRVTDCFGRKKGFYFEPLTTIVSIIQLSDVPDNVQLQKDSDINLMEVLESLAPIPSEEVVAVKPKGEGIERFRRRVEPAGGTSSLPVLPQPQQNNSIFSQKQLTESGTSPSGDGEWDSGHAASSKTKKDIIVGEDTLGSGNTLEDAEQEQEKPVVVKPTEQDFGSTVGSAEESSGSLTDVSAAATQSFRPVSQPPPVPLSQNSVNKETSTDPKTVSFNAAEPEEAINASNRTINESKEIAPTEDSRKASSSSQGFPEASGLGGGAPPLTSADTNQQKLASELEASGSGLNADELAFIAGLQKAKTEQSSEGHTQKKAKLPGSVGNDEDDEGVDDNDNESGDESGEQSDASASGSGEDEEDEETTSGSAESQDDKYQRRSQVKNSSEQEETSGKEDDDDDDDDDVDDDDEESGSGSADDEDNEDDSGESSADEEQRRDTIIDVASGSGVSFISGISQSESDDASADSSGEDDEPQEPMPGSMGQVSGIEKIEKTQAEPATATGFTFSSGSGTPLQSNVEDAVASGSGLVQGNGNSIVQSAQDQTKAKQTSRSGEEELPGSVGSIADLSQLETEANVNADASGNSFSGSGESAQASASNSQIAPEQSLLEQILPDTSSGSGFLDEKRESLPGSIGGKLNLDELQASSKSRSGEEAVQIVKPTVSVRQDASGSGEEHATGADVSLASVLQSSDASGSGSEEQQSASGNTEDFQSIQIPPSEDETLPGSVGAVGPNLMTMASPENKLGSGMTDQSGAGSGIGSGMQAEANLMKSADLTDISGSGSGQDEGVVYATKKQTVQKKIAKPVMALSNKNETNEKSNETTIPSQTKPTSTGDQEAETSGEFGFGLDTLASSTGSGQADEPLPGGFGFSDSTDLQSLTGSGSEDASGTSLLSGSGPHVMDISESASGSAYEDQLTESGNGDSGSGRLSFETFAKKDYAPTASALASASASASSASAEHDSGSSSGSGSHALPVAKHAYLPTPKRVGTGISSATLASSAAGASSGQSDSGASTLPGSVGFEASFSSSGSAIFDTSTSTNEGSGSGSNNIAEFPEDFIANEESSSSGAEMINAVESGAGEGSGAISSGDVGIEESSQRSHTGKLNPFSFTSNSGIQASATPDNFARIPFNLEVGSGSNYGLGSGTGIDYGSASDFLSGSGGSGTLELTPATNPSEAIVDLFGNAISNNEKEKDGESSSSSSLSGGSATSPHKGGKSRHRIPITDEFADDNHHSEDSEEKEQVSL